MVTLGDKEADAMKISAMLSTALTWLVNNIPAAALPPALQPAFQLVKSLVPYLGYISGFIAWSWGEIEGFDTGNGVTLTATWVLPIALIPGTWENEDVPQPPAQPSSPTSDPSSMDPTTSPTAPATQPSAPDSEPAASQPAPAPATSQPTPAAATTVAT